MNLFPFKLTEEQEERAETLFKESIIIDSCLLGSNLIDPKCLAEYGSITSGITTVAHGDHNFSKGMEEVLRYRNIIEKNPQLLLLATTPDDILKAKEKNLLAVVLGFQDAKPIEDDLKYLDAFYSLGVRVIQLTYNIQSYVGSGCIEKHSNGLTLFGIDLIKEMNRIGVAVDLSHCSNETTIDAIKHSKKPVFFTHSNVYTLCKAPGRNKTDDHIRALSDTGGVMGIVFRPNFVKKDQNNYLLDTTIEDLLDHLEYIIRLVGIDHVGFGSDMNTSIMKEGNSRPDWLLKTQERRPDVFGLNKTWTVIDGLQTPKHFINLVRGLVSRGYNDDEIKKFLGGNYLRALKEAWNL